MKRHNRQSVRLWGLDYASAGWYFVTICTKDWACLFGTVEEGRMVLNRYGAIAEACWEEIPNHFPRVRLDAYVIMPNHVHGLIEMVAPVAGAGAVGETNASLRPPRGPKPGSLGAVIGSYKSAINRLWNVEGRFIWQRNYHGRIIRIARGRARVRQYIDRNPMWWKAVGLYVDGRPTS